MVQRLNTEGLRTDNAIGHYPSMGLAEARVAAFERWKVPKAGATRARRTDGRMLGHRSHRRLSL